MKLIKLAIPLFLLASAAQAHEFIVKPMAAKVAQGEPLEVAIYATETYIQAHRLPPESTQLKLLYGGKENAVPLIANSDEKVMQGTLTAPTNSSFLLAATSLREREDKKPQAKQTTDAQPNNTGKAPILRMETFSKAYVNLTKGDKTVSAPIGTKLEVIPLQNPAELKLNEPLKVKVLLNGKPLAARVQATYDGFSDKPHGYVVRTESNDQGEATIPLSAAGLWLIRTKYTSDTGGEGFDRYEASANIVFYSQPN